ncbi:MAG: tryptophan 7-halogenase [Alphaproteobacteria bacterium]|nr:tryptophan 7-halogenase [Alphaproteobacteria bacterium]
MPDPSVLVVGGGPGGATLAAVLAKHGVRVTLLEKTAHPRHHVGESLQPASLQLLDKHLGMAPRMAAQGFARKYGALYVWGETREPWSVLFDERLERDLPGLDEEGLLTGGYDHAWQVERSIFDHLLFEEAGRRGVDLQVGVEAMAPLVEDGRVVGVSTRDHGDLRADLVVDASGQRCLLGRAFGLHRNVDDLQSTATYAYYDGGGGVPGVLGRHVQFVVTVPDGWIWYIPVSPTRTSVGIVVKEKARMSRERFEAILAEAELPALGTFVEDEGLRHVRDWSYACTQTAGPGWLMVGDSACFVDPILSGGVDFAIRGACSAAVGILRILEGADATGVLTELDERLRLEYRAYLRLARYWYGNNRSVNGFFWEAHSELGADRLSTPLRAFVWLTSGRYAADKHFRVFDEWQEQQMFQSLGVDASRLKRAWKDRAT